MGEDSPSPDPPSTVAPIHPPSLPETSIAATMPATTSPLPDLFDADPGSPPTCSGPPAKGAPVAGPAPAGATIDHYRAEGLDLVPGAGGLAAAVPGSVDAWLLLLRDHGTW